MLLPHLIACVALMMTYRNFYGHFQFRFYKTKHSSILACIFIYPGMKHQSLLLKRISQDNIGLTWQVFQPSLRSFWSRVGSTIMLWNQVRGLNFNGGSSTSTDDYREKRYLGKSRQTHETLKLNTNHGKLMDLFCSSNILSITNQKVQVLSPTTANFSGQLSRIITNNLNLKAPIW